MRSIPLALLAALLATGGLASASTHLTPTGNGTSYPEPEESVGGPAAPNAPISWMQPALAAMFMVGVALLLFVAQRKFRRGR